MIDRIALGNYNDKMNRLISENGVCSWMRRFIPNFHYVLEDVNTACCEEDQNDLKSTPGYTFIQGIDKYITLKGNAHHWTTKYVWEKFIPRFCKDYAVPFDESDFDSVLLIAKQDGKEYYLSYHCPKEQEGYSYCDASGCISGTHDKVMRDFEHAYTKYHGLFRGFHRCCVVKNLNADTSRVLFLNCDSMSIPVIPILIRYYKAIIVADNRNGKPFIETMKSFLDTGTMITDWCTLGLARSYCVSRTFEYRETSNNKIYIQNMR